MGNQRLTIKDRHFPRQFLLLLSCWLCADSATAVTEADLLLQQRLKAHMGFLAADETKGRQPGTEGYNISARYVADQFKQMGLIPAGSDGGYFQQVPLRQAWLEKGSVTLALNRGHKRREFIFVDEFYTGPSTMHAISDLNAEMVFVGYGIEAPELGYNDFEHINLEGKIAVTLGGQPADFTSEEGAHFGSSREKARALAAHGAVGWVSIYTPRTEKTYAWERVRHVASMPAMGWLTDDGVPFAGIDSLNGGAIIHYSPAAALFVGAEHALADLLEFDRKGEGLPVFTLNGTLHLAQKSRHEFIVSPNVVAMLRGSDPLLSGEYLVYTAHLDHIGELPEHGQDDVINNGAVDNASGVAVMLETARLFAQTEAPGRSILFVAVTAEEKGLVGSEYFAQNPTVPLASLVGDINLDMPLLLYDFADVIAFGAEHSSLGAAVRQAAAEFRVTLTPDPVPEQNIFVRSDHYPFVQQGIPSVYLITGSRSVEPEVDSQAITRKFMSDHYHRPSDDLNLSIDYAAAAKFTRLTARIGEIVANETGRPSWREGDFFGRTYGH